MCENGDKNEENAEKDDSGRSDDNTTTIEFTKSTVSKLYKTPYGYPWPSRTPCGCCCPDSENTAYMHRFCSLTLTTTIEFTKLPHSDHNNRIYNTYSTSIQLFKTHSG